MDAITTAGNSRTNPRIVLVAVWMAASLLSIPASLVIKFSGENGGWLTFMLMMLGIILVGIWVLLGLLPLFIRGDYASKLAWAWVSLALVFIGFIVGNANMPDIGDVGPATVPTWWFGNEEAASITGGIFLVISAIGHVLWIASCIAYAVLSRRTAPEVFSSARRPVLKPHTAATAPSTTRATTNPSKAGYTRSLLYKRVAT